MTKPSADALEVVVGSRLREQGLTLAVAESCTGGMIGHRLTDVPGSSAYFLGTITTYAVAAKARLLNVRRETLDTEGAVSEATARQMAQEVRMLFRADVGVAVTGIAGPSGGTPEKPVGLTYVALATPDGTWVERHIWKRDRWGNKARSTEAALDLLRRYLEDKL